MVLGFGFVFVVLLIVIVIYYFVVGMRVNWEIGKEIMIEGLLLFEVLGI